MAKIPVAKIEPHFIETQKEETHEGNQIIGGEVSVLFSTFRNPRSVNGRHHHPSTNISTAPVGPSSLLHVRLDPLPFWCHRVSLGNRGRIQQNTVFFPWGEKIPGHENWPYLSTGMGGAIRFLRLLHHQFSILTRSSKATSPEFSRKWIEANYMDSWKGTLSSLSILLSFILHWNLVGRGYSPLIEKYAQNQSQKIASLSFPPILAS